MPTPITSVRVTGPDLDAIDRVARHLGLSRSEVMRSAADPELARRVAEAAQALGEQGREEVGRE